MKSHNRRGLAREGQVYRPARDKVIGAVGPVTPIAKPRNPRSWSATNDRLRDLGNVTVWFDRSVITNPRRTQRGRPYSPEMISFAVVVSHLYRLPLRQSEGFVRGFLTMLGADPDLAPDYATICRRRRTLTAPELPPLTGDVVLVVDATGCSIRSASRWAFEKPVATDRRRDRTLVRTVT
jgi:hypothetical protein